MMMRQFSMGSWGRFASSLEGVLKERRKLDAYLIRSIIIFLFFFFVL